eukprot:6539193-Karenia_brevis.AAC.1
MPTLPVPQTPAGFTLQQPPAQLPPPTTQPGQGSWSLPPPGFLGWDQHNALQRQRNVQASAAASNPSGVTAATTTS